MPKTQEVNLRLPVPLYNNLEQIAKLSGVAVPTVLKVILAASTLRRNSNLQEELK